VAGLVDLAAQCPAFFRGHAAAASAIVLLLRLILRLLVLRLHALRTLLLHFLHCPNIALALLAHRLPLFSYISGRGVTVTAIAVALAGDDRAASTRQH
jgi:hypothetical protein